MSKVNVVTANLVISIVNSTVKVASISTYYKPILYNVVKKNLND